MDQVTGETGRPDAIHFDRATALARVLDLPGDGAQAEGDPLPPMRHQVYLRGRPAQRALGPGGHSVAELPHPPAPELRRMSPRDLVHTTSGLRQGSRGTPQAGLHRSDRDLGDAATAQTVVAAIRQTRGRSGPPVLTTTGTSITRDGVARPCRVDERDIVYRQPAGPIETSEAHVPAPTVPGPGGGWRLDIDPMLLFRFSALTSNAHRIHYDRDYARTHEGYPGLLVHGPPMAGEAFKLGSASSAEQVTTTDITFAYQLIAPMCQRERLTVFTRTGGDHGVQTTVRYYTGRITARIRLRTAQPDK